MIRRREETMGWGIVVHSGRFSCGSCHRGYDLKRVRDLRCRTRDCSGTLEPLDGGEETTTFDPSAPDQVLPERWRAVQFSGGFRCVQCNEVFDLVRSRSLKCPSKYCFMGVLEPLEEEDDPEDDEEPDEEE